MTADLSHELQETFPGVIFNFSQMISDNVEEAMSGVKGENTVKVVGPDLRINEAKANEIVDVMERIRGVQDLGLFPSLGQPNIRITPDRVQCGRYGLNVGDVEAVVQAAIGGQALTQVYEGEKRFDLTVRWLPQYRQDIKSIRNITVATPDGAQVPIGQIAQIVEEDGPSLIYREDNRRYAPVKFSVRGRDLASTIDEAQRRIAEQVKLPYDTHLEWAGEINQLNEATGRLMVIIPITLLVIAMLVYSSVKNWKDMLIVLGRHPRRLQRRHPGAAGDAHALLDLGGDGVHLDLRHLGAGRAHRRDLRAAVVGRRRGAGRGGAPRRRAPPAPGADDDLRGHARADAGGAVARHRRRHPEAAGDRRHRRRADPGVAAAADSAAAAGAGPPRRKAVAQPLAGAARARRGDRRGARADGAHVRLHVIAAFLLTCAVAARTAAADDAELSDPLSRPRDSSTLPARLTLDDALRLLRERGLDLLIADAAIASAEGDVTTAGAIPNPNVSGGLYRSFFDGHLYESHLGWFAGVGDSNAIEDVLSGKRGLRQDVARQALAAARLSRADAQRTLELGVTQLYTQVAAAEAALTFSREVEKSTAKTDDLTKVRFHAGAISEAEAGKIHITKLEADQAIAVALQSVAQSKAALAFVLGVRGPVPRFEVDPLPPSRTPPALAAASLDELLKRAFDSRPDLKLSAAQVSRARSSLRLARRLRFPDIALNLQYEQEGSASGATTIDPATRTPIVVAGITPPTLQLSLTATLPLFYQQQGEIRKAEADVRTQLLGTGKIGAQILSDVTGSYAAFQGSRELVTRMETEMLAQVARVRDLVEIQYQKGAASLLDYLDAYRTYIATNVEYIQDLAAYWAAEHALEAAVATRFE